MEEERTTVSAGALPALRPDWQDAVRRAESGETIAVVVEGKHIADLVPPGEVDRLRETIEVLSDPQLMEDLADRRPVVKGRAAIRALLEERAAREQ